nr:MAG TPA: hypothetical protein [Caudoviricetes sp.]
MLLYYNKNLWLCQGKTKKNIPQISKIFSAKGLTNLAFFTII